MNLLLGQTNKAKSNTFWCIGSHQISTLCLESYPCQHGTASGLETGDRIYQMLKSEGLSHPHFDQYEEHIRRREHPTEEEIVEMRLNRQRLAESEERYIKETAEIERVTNLFKASTRLERLRQQNNIRK